MIYLSDVLPPTYVFTQFIFHCVIICVLPVAWPPTMLSMSTRLLQIVFPQPENTKQIIPVNPVSPKAEVKAATGSLTRPLVPLKAPTTINSFSATTLTCLSAMCGGRKAAAIWSWAFGGLVDRTRTSRQVPYGVSIATHCAQFKVQSAQTIFVKTPKDSDYLLRDIHYLLRLPTSDVSCCS